MSSSLKQDTKGEQEFEANKTAFDGAVDIEMVTATVQERDIDDDQALEEEKLIVSNDGKPGRRVRLVAPKNMPSRGYLLKVTDGIDTFHVKIPKHGIKKGETFEATEVFPEPITGHWSDDLYDCAPQLEGSFFCLAFWFPAIANASILDAMRLDCIGRPTNKTIAVTAVTALTVVSIFFAMMDVPQIMLSVIFVCFMTMTRTFFRGRYKIRSGIMVNNLCCDFFTVLFCGCCSALQMFRHMKRSGQEPECCGSRPLAVTIV